MPFHPNSSIPVIKYIIIVELEKVLIKRAANRKFKGNLGDNHKYGITNPLALVEDLNAAVLHKDSSW